MIPWIGNMFLTPERFQNALTAHLARQPGIVEIRSPEPFVVEVFREGQEEGDELRLILDNFWKSYANSPTLARNGVLSQIKTAIAAPMPSVEPDTFDPACLIPLVRHRDFANQGVDLVSRPLAGDLCVLLGYEGETSLAMLSEDSLAGTGWTAETAMARAEENLREIGLGLEVRTGAVSTVEPEDPQIGWLLPSMLLNGAVMDDIARSLEMRSLLIALPGRSPLYLMDAENPAARPSLEMLVAETRSIVDHPQSDLIFRYDRGGALQLDGED
ncbi:hypothetical protein [Jannaschia aquimarina]|uniref:DUF1444 family protein n=1 Tax=Jannaschia aquimarina TaxID=935700 RepID=A0A0D1EHW1_9RHOB|nr:hypothetical protein [Jannaschia aquimarina]KIT15420.1 hypothetical protein jaqu_28540 [Jannaschia aquimarina]SNT22598.1 hypothetical protein SAMN05421775_10860 [Jannaschia aquimarina]